MSSLLLRCTGIILGVMVSMNVYSHSAIINAPKVNSSNTYSPVINNTNNWAGYFVSGQSITSVSGSFVVPSGRSVDSNISANSTWIGIGGTNSSDLIQTGVQTVINNGEVTNSAFYEILPSKSVVIPNLIISPGDQIDASIILVSKNLWSVNIKDTNTGASYNTLIDYSSSQSSAEWIEEDPNSGTSELALDNFGIASFSNTYFHSDMKSKSHFGKYNLVNLQNKNVAAVSSYINGNFNVTRINL